MMLSREPETKSVCVLCAITISPDSVAEPVAINALHRFGATLRGYSERSEFHAIRNARETLVPADPAPADIPRS